MAILKFGPPKIRPTKRMIDYMEILFNDIGFTHNSRNVFMSNEVHREIKHIDELSFGEAQVMIDKLKSIRDGQ